MQQVIDEPQTLAFGLAVAGAVIALAADAGALTYGPIFRLYYTATFVGNAVATARHPSAPPPVLRSE